LCLVIRLRLQLRWRGGIRRSAIAGGGIAFVTGNDQADGRNTCRQAKEQLFHIVFFNLRLISSMEV
jgi:hypothetical protein